MSKCKCGKELSRNNKSGFCQSCYHKRNKLQNTITVNGGNMDNTKDTMDQSILNHSQKGIASNSRGVDNTQDNTQEGLLNESLFEAHSSNAINARKSIQDIMDESLTIYHDKLNTSRLLNNNASVDNTQSLRNESLFETHSLNAIKAFNNIQDITDESLTNNNLLSGNLDTKFSINGDIQEPSISTNITLESFNIIKLTINKLHEQIDFLQEELREKNLLIKILNFRNANEGDKININLLDKSKLGSILETTPTTPSYCGVFETRNHLVNYDDSITDNTSVITLHSERIKEKKSILCSTPTNATAETGEKGSQEDGRFKYANQFVWERHSSGIASKLLNKMGYRGQGLGKDENGMKEVININPSNKFKAAETNLNEEKNRRKICILSDSMLNRLDGKRLSNDYVDVRLSCHGGCTLKCLYTHLPWAFSLQPEHIIINVGTNDCAKKTSDEVLKELFDVKVYIQKVLPSCKIWFSLPLVRTDNKTANAIIRNLNVKMMKRSDMLLDNSNINERHLSRKGLHLNDHGTKLMAKNIISHIKYI